ncbi:MAG TPA: GIY-YIG nuclease family protein [Candidatus Paceibacterota bacterium]|nr:GIY-YIG nuclease family protein [Candidatus Paceibacterota bacterium]
MATTRISSISRRTRRFFVYILRCDDGTLYTGITTDIARRLTQHKSGTGGAYTRTHGARDIVYTERAASRSAALRREAALKRLTRTQKSAIIAGHAHR